ncbi:MAG TPA: PQQ-binding-like beta-propeller repeat protein, partial [Candidatus Manganitrophaceae bacterium]|nr:PQQ-binding-like beta-propeller repeat protein [Candidatus Manganitrophaceae bacterium]
MRRFHKKRRGIFALLVAVIGFWPGLSEQRPLRVLSPSGGDPAEIISKQEPARTVKWIYSTGNTIFTLPVIAENGMIYVSSSDGFLYSLTEKGTLRWRYRIGPLKHVTF